MANWAYSSRTSTSGRGATAQAVLAVEEPVHRQRHLHRIVEHQLGEDAPGLERQDQRVVLGAAHRDVVFLFDERDVHLTAPVGPREHRHRGPADRARRPRRSAAAMSCTAVESTRSSISARPGRFAREAVAGSSALTWASTAP